MLPSKKCSNDSVLGKLRLNYPSNLSICFININSIRNKFDDIMAYLKRSVDIIVIGETKLDSSFPTNQFNTEGYKTPYRLDISQNKGGIMVYINENIPSRRLLKKTIPNNIQIIPFEINLKKRKFLLGLY